MRYDCPKCQTNLRFRFKGVFRQVCPHCGVRLYRNPSSTEQRLQATVDVLVWLAALSACFAYFILRKVMGDSPAYWLALGFLLGAMGVWLIHKTRSDKTKDWPRWTDLPPW